MKDPYDQNNDEKQIGLECRHARQPYFLQQRLAICQTRLHGNLSIPAGCDFLGPNCTPCCRRRPRTAYPDDPPRWRPVG